MMSNFDRILSSEDVMRRRATLLQRLHIDGPLLILRLTLAAGSLSIQCTNSEQEEAEEELEIAYQGAPLEIGFNINYLTDVLTNLQVEQLQLAFGDANRSALFTLPEQADFKYIVMPMRI